MEALPYFIVGVLFILFGIFSGIKSKAKAARCNSNTVGQIISINKEIEESDKGYKKKISYEPVFQYTVNGQTFEKASNISSRSENEYKIGDTVEIQYNPLKPEEFIVKSKSAQSGIGFAAVMTVIGIGLIILAFTQL